MRHTIELPGIVRAELLVQPLRDRDARELRRVLALMHRRTGIETTDISTQVLTTAARVRAATNLKVADALVVASAALNRCEAVIGNDRKFAAINDMPVLPRFAAAPSLVRMPRYFHLDDYVGTNG